MTKRSAKFVKCEQPFLEQIMTKSFSLELVVAVLFFAARCEVYAAEDGLTKKEFFKQVQQFSQTQDWSACVELSSRYLQAKPGDVDILISRKYALRKLGKNDDALVAMNAVINSIPSGKYVPGAWQWFEYRGDIYMELKQWKNATEDYSKALQWCPSSYGWSPGSRNQISEKRRLCMDAEMRIATNEVSKRPVENDQELAIKIANLLKAEMFKPQAGSSIEPGTTNKQVVGNNKPAQPGTDAPVRDKWALVIGISNFAHSKNHPEQPSIDLKYSAKDAQDFYNYLTTQAKFSKDHVLLLLNEAATRENIMAAFGDKFLPAVVSPGDQVVIYIATHGTPASKDPAKRNFIVAYDTNPNSLYATGVNMEELYKSVQTAMKSNRALIVMDTCYSGAGVPGARCVEDGANFDAAQISQGFGHLVLASSAPNERSWESKVSANGVFTKYLIQDLQLTKGNLKNTFEKLSTDVQWEVQNAFNQPQHPKLGGEWKGEDFNLSISPTEHRPILNPDLLKLMKQPTVAPSMVPSAKEAKVK